MSKERHALTGYKKIRDIDILLEAHTVLRSMTGNDHFPNPEPSLDMLSEKTSEYSIRFAESSKTRSVIDVALKKESKEELGFILKRLGQYVNSIARGELTLLYSSGFEISQPSKSYFIPEKVIGLKIVDAILKGQVKLTFQNQTRVLFYEYSHASEKDTNGEPIWGDIHFTTTSMRNIITDVVPYTYNYFRVRAANKKGKGDWSDAASFFVR